MAEEYKSNSHRSREQAELHAPMEDKKNKKVVIGNVKQRKKSGLSKAASTFMPGDVNSVKRYILMDILIPSFKRAINDVVCNGINTIGDGVCNGINMLLGEPNREKYRDDASAKVGYRQYYRDKSDRRDYARPRAQAQYSYDDIVFDNRDDAKEVLCRMEEMLERFEVVSVADLFDMVGVSCQYTDNKYGWTDLSSAHVERIRDGYIISLPRATSV